MLFQAEKYFSIGLFIWIDFFPLIVFAASIRKKKSSLLLDIPKYLATAFNIQMSIKIQRNILFVCNTYLQLLRICIWVFFSFLLFLLDIIFKKIECRGREWHAVGEKKYASF